MKIRPVGDWTEGQMEEQTWRS